MASNKTKETLEREAAEKKYKEHVETIAQEISKLSRQVSALLDGRMTKEAVMVLLVHSSRQNRSTVEDILDAITGLEKKYLK